MPVSHPYLNPKAEVRTNSIDDKGIFAKEKIGKGELICIWDGDLADENTINEIDPAVHYALQIHDNLWYVTFDNREREATDFFNHSCDPNSGIKGQIFLVAIRDIEPGEEMTFDYAFSESSDRLNFKCSCGSKNCRGRVTGDDWKIPELQEKYFQYFSYYIQEKIKRMNKK